MKLTALVGIAAILPGSLSGMPSSQTLLWVQLCASDGSARTVPIPVDRKPDPSDRQSCCLTACHADRCRKRLMRES